MKKKIIIKVILFLFLPIFIFPMTETVTLESSAINEIAIIPASTDITFSLSPGISPDTVSDTDTFIMNWTTNETGKKITIETNVTTPIHTLTIEATNVSGGTSAGVVSFSAGVATSVSDLVTSISETIGTSNLEFTSTAYTSEGLDFDHHYITYTLTDV